MPCVKQCVKLITVYTRKYNVQTQNMSKKKVIKKYCSPPVEVNLFLLVYTRSQIALTAL